MDVRLLRKQSGALFNCRFLSIYDAIGENEIRAKVLMSEFVGIGG